MRDSASGNNLAAQGTDGDAVSFWMTEARTRVTENPGLEVMAQRTIVLDCPDERLWNAISDPMHWQADAFLEHWGDATVTLGKHVEPDVDHFDIINRLADSRSEIFNYILRWLK